MPIHVTTSTFQSLSNKSIVDSLSVTEVVYFSGGNTNQLVDTLYKNYYSSQYTLQDFISTEWFRGIVKKSGTVVLSSSRVYMLATSDGSSANDYIEINPKPISNFAVSGLADYAVIDTFMLQNYSSAKYIIEVRDTVLNKVHYSDVNIISDGVESVASEYGILYTSTTPLIEYGTTTNGFTLSLTARSLQGNHADKLFKCLRTNFFTS